MGFMKTPHEFENVFRAPFVQVSGRFIGQEQSGSVHKRSGDRHALLFAARQFTRPLRAATRKPDLVQPIFRGRQSFAKGFPLNQQGHRHILGGCEIGQKVMPLPHKTDSAIAILREFSLRQRLKRTPGNTSRRRARIQKREATRMQSGARNQSGSEKWGMETKLSVRVSQSCPPEFFSENPPRIAGSPIRHPIAPAMIQNRRNP